MELMPALIINLTISPFGKFHVKTPKQTLKQLQRKFGHNEYNELHIQTQITTTSLELHLGLLLISPKNSLKAQEYPRDNTYGNIYSLARK